MVNQLVFLSLLKLEHPQDEEQQLLQYQLLQNEVFLLTLKRYETIIEFNNWNDKTWGVPLPRNPKDVIVGNNYSGRNALGVLLTLLKNNL